MREQKPEIPHAMLEEWQRVVDLAAEAVDVPASLIMKTEPPDHTVLVSSETRGNPYEVGASFKLNSKLYCYAVLQTGNELVVPNAHDDPGWHDNQDMEHGMSFYIGYPLAWPDGTLFGTICVLDSRDNEKARACRRLLQEFRHVIESDLALLMEVARRQRAEKRLRKTLEDLESRVAERTRDLSQANEELRQEIRFRRKAEQALLEREHELEEANTALRVLLSNLQTSRQEFEIQILRQIKGLIQPHIVRLRQALGDRESESCYLDLIDSNLRNVTSSFATRLVTVFEVLTPTEAEIAQMVMTGQTTKAIARTLSREPSTVDFHRNNIRRKLGIEGRRVNLRSYLLSLQ